MCIYYLFLSSACGSIITIDSQKAKQAHININSQTFKKSINLNFLKHVNRASPCGSKWNLWIRDSELKLYCRYLYTRPYLINRIWSLKQLWLQLNGHAWFHLHGLRWPVRNGEGAKNSKWKYMFPAGFEPAPRQPMTGKSERLRPLGHAG